MAGKTKWRFPFDKTNYEFLTRQRLDYTPTYRIVIPGMASTILS